MMKKRIAALVTAGVLALSMLTGCGSKQESWKVTCPWAPSGVAAMVSQKAAAKSPDYSDNKITLVAEAVKGDAATVNTWVSSTKANDKELVFAGVRHYRDSGSGQAAVQLRRFRVRGELVLLRLRPVR